MLPGVRAVVVFLLLGLLGAGEAPVAAPTVFVFDETIAARQGQAGDPAMVEAIGQYHRERLARARADLPAAPPFLVRTLRADLGSMDAELERLAVVAGGTLRIGRRVVSMSANRVIMESPAEGTRVEIDPATGTGMSISTPGSEPAPVQMATPPTPIPADRGKPGPAVLGRATLAFELTADGRAYQALVDPSLPNALSWLVPREGEDAAISRELARLPGMPMDISFDNGDFVRRFTCVEAR